VLISGADPDGYPCELDIFDRTYEETAPGSGLYRKTGVTRLVQVPEGVTVELQTKEGLEMVTHPDYIAVGAVDEVYANAANWVEENLEFLD